MYCEYIIHYSFSFNRLQSKNDFQKQSEPHVLLHTVFVHYFVVEIFHSNVLGAHRSLLAPSCHKNDETCDCNPPSSL